MRICLLAPPWVPIPPLGYGGSEAVIDTLARGLVDAGHDVLLVTTGDATCPVPTTWTLTEAAGTGRSDADAVELRHVEHGYEAAGAWGADVVHDHTLAGPTLRHPAIPVVTTNHGPFDSDQLGPFYRSIAGEVPVIAISRHHAESAWPTPIAAVIHHGVDHTRFPVGPGGGGYAAFLGRMVPEKGVATAIRVARAAGYPLKIAAKMWEPAEHAYFDDVVAPMLGGGIEYVGELGSDDKLALLAHASCLLNPIAWPEPFGMVMVESMACGTPVVARPYGSAPELVDDGITGFVRDRDDHLVAALGRVAELDRAACRRAVHERFSAERMVEDHLRLYRRVTAGAAGRSEATLA